MAATLDQYEGALLGLALGDALGAPFEGGPLERFVWRFLGRTRDGRRRFTDDTQMAIDLAESLLARGDVDQDDLARRFANSYRWTRGYGPGAARVLRRIRRGMPWQAASVSVYPDGSFGNGGAMRAPVVALFLPHDAERRAAAARASAQVTHGHPLGMEAAVLVAEATAAALHGGDGATILERAAAANSNPAFAPAFELARSWLGSAAQPTASEVKTRLGTEITATRSCVTALYLAARFLGGPFQALLQFVRKAGGDVDTVGAMAGAIWGARHGSGSLPGEALDQLEGSARIRHFAAQLHETTRQRQPRA